MNWNQVLESLIVQFLIPALAIIAIPLLGKLAREWFSKNGKVLRIVKAAVQFAEDSGLDLIGEEKLALAISFCVEKLAKAGFRSIDVGALVSAIEGEVATALNLDKMIME